MTKINDHWSNKADTEDMANDQIAEWEKITRSGKDESKDDEYLIGQWLVSTDLLTANRNGLENLAILPTNPALYWAGVNSMSPKTWPNVLMVDYIGVVVKDEHNWNALSAELYTLAIGLNLYKVSENCDISKHRSPLLPPLSPSTRLMSAQSCPIACPRGGTASCSPMERSWIIRRQTSTPDASRCSEMEPSSIMAQFWRWIFQTRTSILPHFRFES